MATFRKWKRGLPLLTACLGLSLTAALPMEAMAERGPGLGDEKEEQPYDEATMARLQDNVLEFDEIDKMVHLYNPSMVNAWSSINDSRDAIDRAVTELKSAQQAMDLAKDDEKENNNALGAAVYGAQATALKSIADGMRDGYDSLEKPSTTAQLRQAEYKVIKYGQNTLIGYSSVLAQKETVQQMREMYAVKAAMVSRQRQLGMVTDADVLAAQAELLSAESSLLTIQQTEDQLRRNILLMVGQPASSSMVVQPVTGVDYSRMDGVDLAADTVRAIGNNPDLIDMRHAEGGSTLNMKKRFRSVEEGEQKLTIEMQRLYQDVATKKLAYDASLTGFQNAQLSFQSAQRKKELGMIGNTEFEGLQLAAIQKQSEKAAAEVALFQAIEDYEWAVRGVLIDSAWID